MNIKRLMQIKDAAKPLNLAVCYETDFYRRGWRTEKLISTNLNGAIDEVADKIKNVKGDIASPMIYIIDYSNKPSGWKYNPLCYLEFECKWQGAVRGGISGGFSYKGIDNPQNWKKVNKEIKIIF